MLQICFLSCKIYQYNTLLKLFNFFLKNPILIQLTAWNKNATNAAFSILFPPEIDFKVWSTEKGCGGSPCVSVLTVAKYSCDGHGYLKLQFILHGDFSPLSLQVTGLTARWHTWITAVSLTVSKGTWNNQHTAKPWLLNRSSSRAADFCWLVLVHGRMQSSHQLQLWAPCYVRLSLLWGCLVWSSKINSSDISPCFFQPCREPLQTGTLSGTKPWICMVQTKEKVLAMLEGHLFKSIHPNFWNTKYLPLNICRSQPGLDLEGIFSVSSVYLTSSVLLGLLYFFLTATNICEYFFFSY